MTEKVQLYLTIDVLLWYIFKEMSIKNIPNYESSKVKLSAILKNYFSARKKKEKKKATVKESISPQDISTSS